jgi:hypothetical protein
MVPSLRPPSAQDTPCPYYSNLYTVNNLSRHVKSVHPLASLVFQASLIVLFLQGSSPLVFFPSFIPLASWPWLQAQFSSILGLFESHFACLCLFHRVPWTIQDEIKHAFHLPLDRIARDPTNKLTWFLFLLLPHWCLHYTRRGCLNQWKVSTHLKKFMVGN